MESNQACKTHLTTCTQKPTRRVHLKTPTSRGWLCTYDSRFYIYLASEERRTCYAIYNIIVNKPPYTAKRAWRVLTSQTSLSPFVTPTLCCREHTHLQKVLHNTLCIVYPARHRARFPILRAHVIQPILMIAIYATPSLSLTHCVAKKQPNFPFSSRPLRPHVS